MATVYQYTTAFLQKTQQKHLLALEWILFFSNNRFSYREYTVSMRMNFGRAKRLVIFSVIATISIVSVYFFVTTYFSHSEVTPALNKAYVDTSLTDTERIEILLSQMTLTEKIGQMALVEKNSVHEVSDVSAYGIGGLLSGAGAKPENNTPEGWTDMVRKFDLMSRTSRLGIPILYGVDAIHGHSNVPSATVFPHFIALGASRDPKLVFDVAKATGEELRATGITWSYSPTLDLPKDIRWGRVYEAFSDDPALTGTLGVAYMNGLEQATGTHISVLSTLKHYIGAGSMKWGSSSNKNFKIDQGVTPADENVLRSMYVPPFKQAVDGGALSVMVGLNSWGGTKLSGETHLINDVLKGELGFKGFVVATRYFIHAIPV